MGWCGHDKGSRSSPAKSLLARFYCYAGFLFLLSAQPFRRFARGFSQKGSKEQTDCFERRIVTTRGSNQFRHCCSAVFVVLGLVAENPKQYLSKRIS